MWTEKASVTVLAAAALSLAACSSTPTTSTVGGTTPVTTSSSSVPVAGTTSSASGYGVVQAIDIVPREQSGIGLGTAAGAVVGGLLGNQIGSGSGNTAATVAGAAGGALAGHQIEQRSRGSSQVYRVAVRMDNGAVQTLMQEAPPGVQVGDRVRLDNGVIIERFR